MLGLLVHRVFLQCVQLAFERSSKQGQKNRKGAPPTGFDDLDAIEWGDLNSKRMKRVQAFLADRFTPTPHYHVHDRDGAARVVDGYNHGSRGQGQGFVAPNNVDGLDFKQV